MFTIKSKIIPSLNKNCYTLINKFGIHIINRQNLIDTGLGYCYQLYKPTSISFDDYQKNYTNDSNYTEIVKYIRENKVTYDKNIKSVIHIKVENHAFPLIQMSPNSVIYQDHQCIFKNDSMLHRIMDNPKVNDYAHLQLYEHIFDNTDTKTQISECSVDVVGNQWCFLFWELKRNGLIRFGEFPRLKYNHYYMDKIKFSLLPYAPGGITNIGTFETGEDYEYFLKANHEYQLKIIVSPSIKIKTDPFSDRDRYPMMIHPFITEHDCKFLDTSVSVHDSDYKQYDWSHEHNFGIRFQLIRL